jgi:hypothetical protein
VPRDPGQVIFGPHPSAPSGALASPSSRPRLRLRAVGRGRSVRHSPAR